MCHKFALPRPRGLLLLKGPQQQLGRAISIDADSWSETPVWQVPHQDESSLGVSIIHMAAEFFVPDPLHAGNACRQAAAVEPLGVTPSAPCEYCHD